ncbi:hypothetical protein AMATHDRAFT_153437 [Amanita thiersii Skay4041]|uniref:Uncharacterized protein n=1 Tax=Amanita thiersii Skay4041 TaxID=703135 RepID=A0A2A9NF75_9AGAR|nr:hypothetical protein AMATHDRAFT_153437 [Amanita thiersii Skay4041]
MITVFTSLLPHVFAAPLGVSLTDLPFDFSLYAWNTTRPNANSTGVPLVLGQNGASTGLSFHVTSTYFSYPYNDYPSLRLVNGSLRAYHSSGVWMTNATSVLDGQPLRWVSSTFYSRPAAKDFSVSVAPGWEYPVLKAHGRDDLWYLCDPADVGVRRAQTNVVFDVDGVVGGGSASKRECWRVRVYVVPMS